MARGSASEGKSLTDMHFSQRLVRALPYIVVVAVGAYLWWDIAPLSAYGRNGRLGPDAWPKVVLALLLLAAGWGAISALVFGTATQAQPLSYHNDSGPTEIARDGDDALADHPAGDPDVEPRSLHAAAGIAALIGYVALIPYIGFTIATFLLMSAIMLLAGYTRPLATAIISAVGTLAFFIVFQRVAYLSLPLGAGYFRDFSIGLMALLGVR
jgi:putative tricarboxylic transport membrane protein